ncbi:hypothetical protein HNQ43_001533 [Faecalicoccus acidiformans]|uniref:DUF4830 domain-containing protein n=1 Tax=Faecalicoccus acidiformans TaxID=915173 RepID=A0A7W8D1R6_9FIRM|nr:hypothetical protein [Faecalicoccus acidiformans]MBB5185476.1 hypothetical protein [Faecalicoccus acidiformans]
MNHGTNKSKRENGKPQNFIVGGYKKSLRIFFTLGIATTMAFGLTGCGNSEPPVEEAETEVTEEVETQEATTPEIIGEDSSDTLTIDELLAGIGASDIDEVWNNQEALDFIANWMEQNGYYDVEAKFAGDVPVCEAHSMLQSDGSEMYVYVEVSPSYGGKFMLHADRQDGDALGERLAVWRSPELPSALKVNETIEQGDWN